MTAPFRRARINLAAIERNVARLRQIAATEHFIAVVKADAYGHGMLPVAYAALAGGADWLGTADLTEALALREGGIAAPILAWLHPPETDFAPAIEHDVDIGVSWPGQLRAVVDAAGRTGRKAHVQFKLDTGLSRNGCAPEEWSELFAAAADAEREGTVHVRGLFTHVSNASDADDEQQVARFDEACRAARAAALDPELEHIAATSAMIRLPAARRNAVRVGIGIYGLSPLDDRGSDGSTSDGLGLTRAMTVTAPVTAVRRVAPGTGVSYDYTHRVERETTLVLVPLGYGDGMPRQASNRVSVGIRGRRYPVRGRIAMDQFVVEVGDDPVEVGDEVTVFGDGAHGGPTADDWAEAAETIHYEIVTRIGPRVQREYVRDD